MVEALRGLGYTTASALADLIDNSISAGSTRVEIGFHWAGVDSWIRISDDGRGMTDAELDKAMRIGDRNPLLARDAGDLGRFGLGLKTASFSQARCLTVSSRKGDEFSRLRWDLDVLAGDPKGNWSLLEGAHPGSEKKSAIPKGSGNGTVVLWERLDRIVTPGFKEQNFLDLIDHVDSHLGMVFHRYLDRSTTGIEILLNDRRIRPWDPFLTVHGATWRSPEVQLGSGALKITAQAFVLPHKDRLGDKDYLNAGGPEGWASHQGFYIYRGRRMLVAGSWLGLGRTRSWSKDESHRLARIRIDITNSSDADWKIDIRKSTAQPPVALKELLIKLAEDARDRARRVYLHRAQLGTPSGRNEPRTPVWTSEQSPTGRRYRVDRRHPAITALTDEGGELAKQVEVLLRVLEQTIPVQRIWLEAAETGEHAKGGFTAETEASVKEVLMVLYRNLVVRKGVAPDAARALLLKTEPFDLHPGLVRSLPEVIPEER
jgi:Histidine kinase-, DNA gyrase B-, and HSP90-like ATPase